MSHRSIGVLIVGFSESRGFAFLHNNYTWSEASGGKYCSCLKIAATVSQRALMEKTLVSPRISCQRRYHRPPSRRLAVVLTLVSTLNGDAESPSNTCVFA